MSSRTAAATVLKRVLEGESLNRALPEVQATLSAGQRPKVQALSYGALRQHEQITALLAILLHKKIRKRDFFLECLLRIALYEALDGKTPSHALVKETVSNVKRHFRWASGMANATLRRYYREEEDLKSQLESDWTTQYNLPEAWLVKLKKLWPENWQEIAASAQTPPPMTLRVALNNNSRAEYLGRLQEADITATKHPLVTSALVLDKPVAVDELPDFNEGLCSVQDAAAQLAASYLQTSDGQRVLDACAAPGGKTMHLLENSALELTAVDSDAERLLLVADNLARGGFSADLKQADASDLDTWWDGKTFDRILLDAPCSASGVLRRHPDIKLHRTATDIEQLVNLQARLLDSLWQSLSPGGRLLYATCSIWSEENQEQVKQFLQRHQDAQLDEINLEGCSSTGSGLQILPGYQGMDGFYYAAINKQV